jgi:hypothetical protein
MTQEQCLPLSGLGASRVDDHESQGSKFSGSERFGDSLGQATDKRHDHSGLAP